MDNQDTIIACATSLTSISALNVIRLSGDKSFSILQKLVSKDINEYERRKTYHVFLRDEGKLIDDALIVLFQGKESFCGEDTVEFYLHGSPIIAYNLIKFALKNGARMARKGEFSYKAVINGKMSILEAERTNALIHAKTSYASEKVLSSFSKDFFKPLQDIKEKIAYLYAYFLQVLDYPEEYNDEDDKVISRIDELLNYIDKIKIGTKMNNYLFSGVKVVICGEPNVGKSTLLNRILEEDRAIVTPIEGTTRDVIEGYKEISGVPFTFYDTAGIRDSSDVIEKIGIDKSFSMIEKADVVLLLSDSGRFDEEKSKSFFLKLKDKNVIKVQTKEDIKEDDWDEAEVHLSSSSDLKDLYEAIFKKLNLDELKEPGLFSMEDYVKLNKIEDILKQCKEDFAKENSYDLLTISLNEAHHKIKELLGEEYDPNEIYDVVFSSFCVGK